MIKKFKLANTPTTTTTTNSSSCLTLQMIDGRWDVLIYCAPDTKLAVSIVSPAPEGAVCSRAARMKITRSHGDDKLACQRQEAGA